MDAPLSQREFDTWRESDTTFKEDIRQFMQLQTDINLNMEGRMSSVEGNYEQLEQRAITRIGLISSFIAAVIGSVGGWLAGK